MKDVNSRSDQHSLPGSLEVRLKEGGAERFPHFILFVSPAKNGSISEAEMQIVGCNIVLTS